MVNTDSFGLAKSEVIFAVVTLLIVALLARGRISTPKGGILPLVSVLLVDTWGLGHWQALVYPLGLAAGPLSAM